VRLPSLVVTTLNNTGFPPIKQTLASDSKPPLSLVPQRKRGSKKGKRKCPIYMLSGIASG
jgi:hypothetical protein